MPHNPHGALKLGVAPFSPSQAVVRCTARFVTSQHCHLGLWHSPALALILCDQGRGRLGVCTVLAAAEAEGSPGPRQALQDMVARWDRGLLRS